MVRKHMLRANRQTVADRAGRKSPELSRYRLKPSIEDRRACTPTGPWYRVLGCTCHSPKMLPLTSSLQVLVPANLTVSE